MKQYISARLKKENGKIQFVASDETLDRANEVIPMDSWDINNFMKNPVLLVDHDYRVENIVGLATNLTTNSGKLTFEPLFHGITELAKNVKQMVEEGFLNSVSVGFLPHQPKADGERISNELLEISFVPVGANPNALRLNAIKSVVLPEDKKKQVEAWLTKQNETLELQSIEFAKSKYKDEPAVESWLKENNYIKAEISDSKEKDAFIVKYFDADKCAEGSMKDIDLGDGIKMFACKTSIREVTPAKEVKDNIIKRIEAIEKEGRVLSGKNRKQIDDAVGVLKQAIATLEELLDATSKSGKDDSDKSRETEVEQVKTAPQKAPSSVVRVLQDINRNTNRLLSELKE